MVNSIVCFFVSPKNSVKESGNDLSDAFGKGCAIHSLDEVLQEVISSCYFVQISFEIALNRF